MELNFGPRGILQIDDARIIHRNFAGIGGKFNREGDRNFSVVIPTQEMVDALVNEGWNVKIKPPREEGEEPFMYLPVKIKFTDRDLPVKSKFTDRDLPVKSKFTDRGPAVYLKAGTNDPVRLDEDSIDCIDEIDIASVDMDIRPYDWEVNGKTGRTAYLQSIHVIQDLDRFAARYDNIK